MHLRKLITEIYSEIGSCINENVLELYFSENRHQDYKGERWIERFSFTLNFIINNNKISYDSISYNKHNDIKEDELNEDIILLSKKVIDYDYDEFINFAEELYDLYNSDVEVEIDKEEFIKYIKEDLRM